VKAIGSIGVVGFFQPKDPKLRNAGRMDFDFGNFWMKGQRIATGQANVKSYNRQLCTLISVGKAKPSLIISHELPLGEAPEAYKHFDACDKGWTKVILKPEW
jgi:threonine dehydrogenase-like Zn-dependent dehydrogenase